MNGALDRPNRTGDTGGAMNAAPSPSLHRRAPEIFPETATGWLRFGVTALPKTAPPRLTPPF